MLQDVEVPADFSRRFRVPAYDIPVLEHLWSGSDELKHRATAENPSGFKVTPSGVIEDRSEAGELARLKREYPNLGADMATRAVDLVYPSAIAFANEFRRHAWKEQIPEEMVIERKVDAAMAKRGKNKDT
jgi:hypothetical protein